MIDKKRQRKVSIKNKFKINIDKYHKFQKNCIMSSLLGLYYPNKKLKNFCLKILKRKTCTTIC